MLVSEGIYKLQPNDLARFPPEFILRRGIQAGGAATSQIVPVFEGFNDRCLVISALNVRVSLTGNAAGSRLEVVRLEANDITTGTLRTVLWEAIFIGSPAAEGVVPEHWNVPLQGVLADGNRQANFTVPLVGTILPPGVLLRFVLGTAGSTPSLLAGTSHLVAMTMPQGNLSRG